MKKRITKILFVLLLASIPAVVYAAYPLPRDYRPSNAPPSFGERTIGSFDSLDIVFTLGDIMGVLLTVAGGVAVYFLVVGGFTYVTSFGNQEKTDKAKNIIKWAILGLLVILFSYIIVENILQIATTDIGPVQPDTTIGDYKAGCDLDYSDQCKEDDLSEFEEENMSMEPGSQDNPLSDD